MMDGFARRVWTVAVVLALLTLGVFIRGQLPNPLDRVFARFDYTSSAPEVGTVEDTRAYVTPVFNGMSTNASWMVVDFRVTPEASIGFVRGSITTADGTEFTQSNSWSNSCPVLYPGRTVDCTFVFEMPENKIDDATLKVLASWDHMAPRVVVKLEKPLVEGEIVREGVTV